ncbi:TetR family transcriptional regulator [Gordonia otitidis]|uniref:TetR family transcriptional regulator n=1 Tax=Gordonia otitidis (strain DSM 44809 / CCUG 52243 / JCM 12355 / NBRC 100426 / IFM 10032) TaxID=1108044 RepID=H5TL94_GORO1|nr:TetR family transcriptional regulator [Gordonia otitidis]GAB34252.1 putative TetR family transcriptional regulator [Gordonia otitidis NBRC 100426]
MSNNRADVLRAARGILTEHSLADLSMRRLASEVGVRPNALYWHFPNKQSLLAALADDILGDIGPTDPDQSWDGRLGAIAVGMRAALLAVPDSAEVVSSAWASGLGTRTVADDLTDVAISGGLTARDACGVATAICQLIIGLTIEEQTRAQMERLGVIGPSGRDFAAEFDDALGVLLDGARQRAHVDDARCS